MADAHDCVKEKHAIHIVISGVVNGEVMTYVLFTQGGQDCIHNCVDRHVAVTVCNEGVRAGDFHSKEGDPVSFFKAVDVISRANSVHDNITFVGDFAVVFVTFNVGNFTLIESLNCGKVIKGRGGCF